MLGVYSAAQPSCELRPPFRPLNRGLVSAHLNTLKGVRINGWDSELWNIAEWHR